MSGVCEPFGFLYIYCSQLGVIFCAIGVELVGIPASFKAIILAAFFVGNCEQGSFSSLLHRPTAVCDFDWDATIAAAALLAAAAR
ncbi:hypothetical protein [Neisseria sp.]